jgi:hypothetical protein
MTPGELVGFIERRTTFVLNKYTLSTTKKNLLDEPCILSFWIVKSARADVTRLSIISQDIFFR